MNFLNYFRLFHDSGVIYGQVILKKKDDAIPYVTRDIPEGLTPKVIVFEERIYVDTGTYDDSGFRIYEQNLNVYWHTSYGE